MVNTRAAQSSGSLPHGFLHPYLCVSTHTYASFSVCLSVCLSISPSTMMVNGMCSLDQALGCSDIWSYMMLGVSLRVCGREERLNVGTDRDLFLPRAVGVIQSVGGLNKTKRLREKEFFYCLWSQTQTEGEPPALSSSPAWGLQILGHLRHHNHGSPFPLNTRLSVYPSSIHLSIFRLGVCVHNVDVRMFCAHTCKRVHVAHICTWEGEVLGEVWTRSHHSFQVWSRRLLAVTNTDVRRDDRGRWWTCVSPTLPCGRHHPWLGSLSWRSSRNLKICLVFFP